MSCQRLGNHDLEAILLKRVPPLRWAVVSQCVTILVDDMSSRAVLGYYSVEDVPALPNREKEKAAGDEGAAQGGGQKEKDEDEEEEEEEEDPDATQEWGAPKEQAAEGRAVPVASLLPFVCTDGTDQRHGQKPFMCHSARAARYIHEASIISLSQAPVG